MVGPQCTAAVRNGTRRAVGRLRRYRAVGIRIVQPDVARSRRADAGTQMGGRTPLRWQDRRRFQLCGAAAERRSARVQLSELPRFAARHHDRGARGRSRRARHARGVEARRIDVSRADGVRRNGVDFRRDDDVPISAATHRKRPGQTDSVDGEIRDHINTVVRQISFSNFERTVHEARRNAKLTVADFNAAWMD